MKFSFINNKICYLALVCFSFCCFSFPAHAIGPTLVLDIKSGQVLHSENPRAVWHPASLTKLMTAYTLFQEVKMGRMTLNSKIKMTYEAATKPPSRSNIMPGREFTLANGLMLLIVKSANDVAVALAQASAGSEQEFANRMNWWAQKLGMTDSYFVNAHGLHHEMQRTSARDMAILGQAIFKEFPKYSKLFQTRTIELDGKKMQSYNNLLERYPGVTGMKTGYICPSGYNVITSAKRGTRHYLAVILGARSSLYRGEVAHGLLDYYLKGGKKLANPSRNLHQLSHGVQLGSPYNLRPVICRTKNKQHAYPASLISPIAEQFRKKMPPRVRKEAVKISLIPKRILLPKRRPILASDAFNSAQMHSVASRWGTNHLPKQYRRLQPPRSRPLMSGHALIRP